MTVTTKEPADAIAEREREIDEERQYDAEFKSADALPQIGSVHIGYPAKIVRDWVRSVLLPPVLKRLYDTGMGVQTFDTPTAAGNVVQVEAPPSVQVKAMQTLVAIGVPTQLGIADDNGNVLPGVIALGSLDLDAARASVHGERYVSPDADARLRAGVHALTTTGQLPTPATAPAPMAERIAAGEYEMVEVIEGVGSKDRDDADTPPGPIPERPETTEQRLLRTRREKRQKAKGNGA